MLKKIVLFSTLTVSTLFAGGDNRVSMTDIKEALYNLVIESGKTEKSLREQDDRISNIEPKMPIIDRNSKHIAIILDRLNTLGVPMQGGNEYISSEIARFVDENKYLLPQSAAGVR